MKKIICAGLLLTLFYGYLSAQELETISVKDPDNQEVATKNVPADNAVKKVDTYKEKKDNAVLDKLNNIKTALSQRTQHNTKDQNAPSATPPTSMMSLDISIWRFVLTLFILIVLIVGCMYLIKVLGKRFGAIESNTTINVLTKLQIDTKNSLLLVRLYEQELLLGVSNERISLLSKYHTLSHEELDTDTDEEVDTVVEKSDSEIIEPDVIVDIKNMKSFGENQ